MSNCTPLRRQLPAGWAVLSAPHWKACLQARARGPDSNWLAPWPQFAGLSRDVTVRKNRQIALHRSERSTDERLAMVAHELRAPLQPIRLAAALLAQLHVDGPAIECKAIVIIQRQVGHLSRLVEDLLDDARLTHGKIRLVPEVICLSEVIEAAIDANRALVEANRLQLQLQLPSEAVWLRGDNVRLTQVFSNLLHNAAKFSVAGGTIVVRVDAGQADRPVAVSVRDDGIGMAPELIGSVFELFTQQDPTLAPDHGGLGIGLSVVRGLVELHGGTVTAHSAGIGTGSEFVVTLPSATRLPSRESAPKVLLAEAVALVQA
ncbi:MAG TPA: HAMP domain-containing sensor histidine kinase [Ideonella sp.]|jgi:signal transduction histidine kinase|nr:HAMP domain-containing sensor histidine kinase [Ideonella sp.]